MRSSFLSYRFKRMRDVLRRDASDQIPDYTRSFDPAKGIYDSFLKDLARRDFSTKDATTMAKTSFGS